MGGWVQTCVSGKLIGFWCMSYFSFDGHWILLDGMQWSNGRWVPFPEENNPSEVPPEATEEEDDDVAFLLKARTLSLLLFSFLSAVSWQESQPFIKSTTQIISA